MFETITRNTLAQVVGKAIGLILSFISTGLLTRLLGQEGFGQYSLITALVLLFGNVANWGTDTIAVREASKTSGKQSVIFGNTLLLRLILSALSVFLLVVLSGLVPDWSAISFPLALGSFVLIFLSLKTSMNIIFQTRLRYDMSSISELVGSAVLTLIVYVIYVSHGTLNQVIVAWLIATICAGVVAVWYALKIAKLKFSFDKKISYHLLKESLFTGALLLVYSIYNRIDIIILERLKGFSDVSQYGLAYKLYEQLILGAAFFMNTMFPYFSRAYATKSLKDVRSYYQKSFDLLFVVGVFVLIISYIGAPYLVAILAPDFVGSTTSLRILSFALLIAYFNHLTGYSLISFGKQKTSFAIAIIALVFNITANFLFIPNYSYVASSVITVATEALVLVLSSIVIYKTIGVVPSLTSWLTTLKELLSKRKINF